MKNHIINYNNDFYKDIILYLCYIDKKFFKQLSYERCYTLYYNMTIYNQHNIKDWFNNLFNQIKANNLLIKNINETADILLYPINNYDITYIKHCNRINNEIIYTRLIIIKALNIYLSNDLIEWFYCKYLISYNIYYDQLLLKPILGS